MNAPTRKDSRRQVPPPPPPLRESFFRALTRTAALTYFRIDYVDRHHIPADGPAILIPNHPTYIDPWLVAYATNRWVTWLAWDEAFDWAGVGWLIKQMHAVPISLEKPSPSTLKTAHSILAAERLLGIFFEGARTTSGFQLDEPRPGAARIALKAKVPVIPISVAGARRLWPIDGSFPRPGKLVIRSHPPIDPEQVEPGASARVRAEALTARIADAIRSGLPPCGRHRHG